MKKLQLVLLFLVIAGFQLLQAQGVQIIGKVTGSEDGQPIVGATVLVKGTTIGTVTDYQGKYVINVPAGATSLVFSFVGMITQEVAVAGKTTIDIVLQPEVQGLQEVVVTAFGIKRQSRELGSATAKVSDKELTEAGASNVVNGLTGKVSGLQINTINNGVNPDTRITLRGNRHFLASNEALVVLDGVPITADYLNSINPNDIDNVNILKGASAAALYGNDASNGVMIITTKKGNSGKPVVKISNVTTFDKVSYLPNLQTRFGSGSGESVGANDPNYTFWIGKDRNTDPYTAYENQSYGPEYNGQMVILGGKLADGSYQMVPYSPIKDQKLNFFNTGVTTQNDVSYSAGDQNSSFYLSGQNVNTTGVVPGDKNNRSAVRMSGSKTYGKFGAEFTMGYTQTNTDVSGNDFNQGRPVYWNVLNTPGEVPLTQYKDMVNNPFATLDGYYNAYYPNPYWQIEHARLVTKKNDVLGSVVLNLKPTEWLEFSNRTGLVYDNTEQNYKQDEAVFSAYSHGDPWGGGHNGQQSPYKGNASNATDGKISLTNDFLAKISKDFGDFSTKFILGTTLNDIRENALYMQANGLVIPFFYNISNRTGEANVTQGTVERRSLGAFVDATLGFKNFAFLHVSGRNDWDSRLVKANRSFFYPAADLSLVLSDMVPALKESIVSYLKVRGGWSKTGLVSLKNYYATIPAYTASAGFPYGGTAGFIQSTTLSNPNLKPEITEEIEGGFELSLLNNRIHFDATYYTSHTKDQTIPASLSTATGYYSAYINSGELESQGLETDLKLNVIKDMQGFSWSVGVNYTYNTSKVLSIYPGLDELPILDPNGNASVSYAIKGEQYPAVKVSDVMRDPAGHIIVDPVTGLPSKNGALVFAGHASPNQLLGLVTTVSYKGLTLNAVMDYRSGNVTDFYVGQSLDFTGISEHSALNGRQSFVIPNSVIKNSDGTYSPNTNVVVASAGRDFWNNSAYENTQMAYTTSAAFWKLREVSITYDLPVTRIFNGAIKGAQLGLVGRNLLLFRPRTNVWTDPEFNNSPGDSNALGFTTEYQTPPTRVYGFSVKLTF